MTSQEEPFQASALKVARSKRHLEELQAAVAEYFAGKPFVMRNEPSTLVPWHGNHAWTVRINRPVPVDLSAIIGDVIHNLRSALDHLACDLVRMEGVDPKKVYFPFCKNKGDLRRTIKDRYFHRASKDAVAIVESLQPYKGGNNILYAIHDMDITDKHSALIPVAAGAVSPSATVQFTPSSGITPIPSIGNIISDGQVFIHTLPIPGLPLGAEIPAKFYLVFGPNGGDFQGHEILETLHSFVSEIEKTLELFRGRRNPPVTTPG